MALFDISTADEIVVDTNTGGRSTFKNAGRTRRAGLELGYTGQLSESLRASLSLTALRARFSEAFVSGSGATALNVPAGSRLAGAPERSAYAELAWSPKAAWGGFNAAVEVVHVGKIFVNDINDDAAPAATVLNLRAGLSQQSGGLALQPAAAPGQRCRQGLCRLGDRQRRQPPLFRARPAAQLVAGPDGQPQLRVRPTLHCAQILGRLKPP